METIIAYFDSIHLDFFVFAKCTLILLLGTMVFSLLGRFIFGKRSMLSHAVSSAIAILFIFAVTIVLRSCGAKFDRFVAPLPFVDILGDHITLFRFSGAHYTAICAQVLSMIILAFLVNLAEGWFSKGKNFICWLFFRCLIVSVAYVLHLVVVGLFAHFLPEGLVVYAPTVLLVLLVLLIATGALKIIVGALLSTVDPIIGGLYTFFFAHKIGKMITKATLTTALLVGLVFALQYAGLNTIYIASSALTAYVPILCVLVALWYLTSCIL